MKYAILVGEKLIYAKDYYFCNNGELITNFNKDIEAMTRQGFKVVVDEKPEYDKDLQSLSIVGYEETDDSIKIIYEVLNIPEPKPNQTLEDRVASLEVNSIDIVATTWDMDYRMCEIEWALVDSGILAATQVVQTFNLKEEE